jgi:formate dehydrogenase subunit gamma
MGLLLTAVIIAHIYIGTIGMEGAFDAMGSGEVDENWAREHHNLWVQRLEKKRALGEGDD